MTHTSPASYLVWSVIAALVTVFLVFHLWSFDRFKCLRWNNGPYSGAFKRIMTYSYLVTLPLILVYALGMTIIKYTEGYIYLPTVGVIPKPHQAWSPAAHQAILPLMIVFSIGWSLEMVTHLEELCFWLFLVNSGSSQQDWFRSLYFRTWSIGSIIAILYMPLVTIFTRSDPLKCEAYTFLAGSLGSLSLTLWFVPVLWTFPGFLNSLRRDGVDTSTIVRLTKFSELNTIRIVFRFLFTVPLLILGVDGVTPHKHANESAFATDFLIIVAGFGCAISSAITLVIFFPRSIEGEIAAKDAVREARRTRSQGLATIDSQGGNSQMMSQYSKWRQQQASSNGGTYLLTSSPIKGETYSTQNFEMGSSDNHHHPHERKDWIEEGREPPAPQHPPLRPVRRTRDVEAPAPTAQDEHALSESNLSMHNMHYTRLNPMITNFTSPIDFVYQAPDARLTFTQQ